MKFLYILGGIVFIVLIGILTFLIMKRQKESYEGQGPGPSPRPADTDTDTDTDTDMDTDPDADPDMDPDTGTGSDDDDTELKKRISKEKGKLKRSPQIPRATLEHDLDPGLKRDFAPFIKDDDEEPQGDRSLEAQSVKMTMKGTPTSDITPSPSPVDKVEN